MKQNTLYLFVLFIALLSVGCSVERSNPLSKTYHNTTARYNGYFLAREKLRAVEEALQAQMQYDYNQVIPLYPTIDSTTAKAAAADLEDIVKKASFPIQYHKNSKWIDDSYILIGRARYYQLDFADAARTFKYANTISKDKDARHEALVWLMRTYLQMGEEDNANQVSELLRRERLNKDNARELYLARAQYHRMLGDTAAVIENLALSIPNFEEKDAQSRVRFVLAQLYQSTDQDKEAYKQYSRILKRNPPYDLGFFSRLYIGQVSELSDEQDQERIAGFYEKMLKDEKNVEYKDKILYEMAQFELRKENFEKALTYLQRSIKERGSLPNQKAYSYLLAGKIYFDHLGKYNMAQAYYDSAVQVYPKTAPEYEAVAERRDVLTAFATQYNTIQTQDSLQRIARMSESDRMTFLQQLVQREEEDRQQVLARQQQQSQTQKEQRRSGINSNDAVAFNPTTNSAGVWYFDNPAAMASARSEFIRIWGDRPLQDFWRIRSRGESGGQQQVAQQTPDQTIAAADSTISPEARAEAQIQTYLQDIPLTTAAIQRSEKMVEEALFTLGNIYNQNLKNSEKATETYEQLLKRFPNTEHAAETYYALYLIYSKANNEAQKQVYYNKIKQQFPKSSFAQLVDDADFMSKNAAENLKAHTLYDSAYTYYEDADYKMAQQIVNQLVSQYPHSDIQDKTAYLEILITARTKEPQELKQQLERFQKTYPASSLQTNVTKLLATYSSLEQKNQLRKEAPAVTTPKDKDATSSLTPEEKVSTIIASTASAQPTTIAKQQPDTTQPTIADTTAVKDTATIAQPASTMPDTSDLPDSAAVAASLPAPDPMAYSSEPDSAYYFVLIYPTGHASFKDIVAKYQQYNNRFFKAENLTITEEPFATGKTMLVGRSINDLKTAKSYNIKQKGPQAPVGTIRGIEFVTFVISSANYSKFMQKKDVEAYQTFFKNNY
ncbi:tetratricopeptide repeat protein [Pontibacter sp. BT310]|uniref:Tetratricopeptide repeat protein n=1 Tax=Pontibacter populi TaxID=890055 RepID=A0ABS6XBU7_9BACT|nr:tetratricopeptide repeat protein [Pontibacter sp. BT310]MBJ6117788.1 tetratricopeptide repeat protein [Pontibacter sp. BT310]MBR0570214.1 tetratricopeptide repeat protein [Microvirga sp. STS03]MBW3364640.1 tetratricopeptide repeat protein [Pontibacter populi]